MINFASRAARFLRRNNRARSRYYCDYAAATPLSPDVAAAMDRVQRSIYGNASAIHAEGAEAQRFVEEARVTLARALGVRAEEITFTASGTEANNLAIIGFIEAAVAAGKSYSELEIISTKIEHPSVSRVLEYLAGKGVRIQYAPVDEHGAIQLASCKTLLSERTSLVTFAYANSEVGTIQPVRALVRMIRKQAPQAVVHLDAAQAPLWLTCNRHQLGVDMLSLDASKCNGPKGVGVLVKRADCVLSPVTLGGGQEQGLRAGTENTAGIVGASMAIAAAQNGIANRVAEAQALSVALVTALKTSNLSVQYNGPEIMTSETETSQSLQRLPNNVHISLPGFDTEYAVVYLDKHGIAASTKSACSGAGGGMSTVLMEMTQDAARASSTIRFSLDPTLDHSAVPHIAKTLANFCQLQNSVD